MRRILLRIPLLITLLTLCHSLTAQVEVGADQIEQILTYTAGKRVALTVNHTSVLSNPQHTHLVDTLLAKGVQVTQLFTPEHGLRGTADAGAAIRSGIDSATKLPVISLYGKKKKPTPSDLSGIDLMIFDLQDVGVRFYTYISTLTYLMEACAEEQIPLLILDRPNPHDTIDGPVRKQNKYRSFVSLLPIPAVHGITLGEAAQMINGEGWLKDKVQVPLTVIRVKGWQHGDAYSLPLPPSPNLRSDKAIHCYPTICYFEASSWSEGRGTTHPFEQIGYPNRHLGSHSFIPHATKGASKPKHSGKRCYGPLLQSEAWPKGIYLPLIIEAYQLSQAQGIRFFARPKLFDLLAGNGELRQQIQRGLTAEEIRQSWQSDLSAYKKTRAKYLLYPDNRY